MKKMFYDEDVDLSILNDKKIGVIGYGIQGKAQALNLRDSGLEVRVGNRKDMYTQNIIKDGFKVYNPQKVADWADVIMFLIPDQAQAEVYDEWIKPYLKSGNVIVFAHGYCLYYNRIILPEDVDVVLLAPRMPGAYIRDRYLNNWGVPVFIDAVQDYSGNALSIVLSLAKGIGATRIGAMEISYKEETEIDLFIEQFLLPVITSAIHKSFDYLVDKGFTPEAVISELYASAEIGKLITEASESNIYQVFRDHASPTCQYGKMVGIKEIEENIWDKLLEKTLFRIRSKNFDKNLFRQADNNYEELKTYNQQIDKSQLVLTHRYYTDIHRNKDI